MNLKLMNYILNLKSNEQILVNNLFTDTFN